MTPEKLEKLFELAEELYHEEVERAGVSVIPFCYAQRKDRGQLLVFSAFGTESTKLASRLSLSLALQNPAD